MKRFICLICSFFTIISLHAKQPTVVTEPEDLTELGTISMLFLYDNIEIDKKSTDNSKVEITEKDFGQPSINLLIYDFFYNSLQQAAKINLSKRSINSNYTVKINLAALPSSNSVSYFCSINIYDNNNKQICYFLINENYFDDIQDLESFAKKFTTKIITELKKIS